VEGDADAAVCDLKDNIAAFDSDNCRLRERLWRVGLPVSCTYLTGPLRQFYDDRLIRAGHSS
ncbi:hypothetical protein AB4144_26160, partial [Rhizobiaceae sp. 2RAB30]